MKKQLFLLSTVALLLASCSTQQPISTNNNTSTNHPSENAVLWQQTAAEYDALCYQAYNIAKSNLEEYSRIGSQAGDLSPAIIMDIDETVLDNSAYYARLILENKSFNESSWQSWINEKKAPLIPGARDFIQYAQEIGIPIFYISNRTEEMIQATIDNLQIHGIDAQPNFMYFKSETSQKSERYKNIMNEYNVVLFVGDNLADFGSLLDAQINVTERNEITSKSADLFGKRFILLPNPMYGNWIEALEYEDRKATNNYQEFDDSRKYLKPMHNK